MANVFVAWDADHAGKLIGQARLHDDAEQLARISNQIDKGNELFKAWALNHAGSVVSMGGDEGLVTVPAVALQDLPDIKARYESALTLTVSIGIGMRMSEGFKALLASKLRGRNRTTIYDKDVEKEVAEAAKSEDDTKQKIVDEYLGKDQFDKRQPVHHVGSGGTQSNYQIQEQSANPEVQQEQDLEGFKHQVPEDINNFETEFHKLASEADKKDRAQKTKNSEEIKNVKQKVAQALQAVHQQLPQLAEIRQAAPETYAAVIGVVQGLIAMGRQLQDSDQQLSKAIATARKNWVGCGSTIPAFGTPERQTWDNNYKQAVANYFTEGQPHKLKLVKVPINKVLRSHQVLGNEAKTRLYHRMVRGGDKMPPGFGHMVNGHLKIIDGNRRLDVALANKLPHFEAYVQLGKSEVDIYHNTNLPPDGMLATSTGGFENYDLGMDKSDLMPGGAADSLRPEDFDQEQLAIGTQHELEHTNDPDLAREIAMDHLTEDPDYYKQEEKSEPLNKMALIHNDPERPMTVYRVQRQDGTGPYHPDQSGNKHDVELYNLPKRNTPVPDKDFLQREFKGEDPSTRFGFETPQHAVKWFGKETLDDLASRGFSVTPVKASKVFRSKSGRQLLFYPHSSETKLNIAKADLPMSEEKEELDPAKPVDANSKGLDKGVVPEHIKSIRAHRKLVPGEILDSRHIVVQNASGKNAVREVSSGMQRDLTDSISNPVGPAQGNPTSARNRPSRP